jgi:2'-5' RNA ligase
MQTFPAENAFAFDFLQVKRHPAGRVNPMSGLDQMSLIAKQHARLYYALWPNQPMVRKLGVAQTDVVGRKVNADQLHLTLAFLGNQPIDKLPALAAVLAQLPPQGFVIELDRYGYFKQQKIAWIGPTEVPLALLALRRALLMGLSTITPRLKAEPRFVPHVTLARDAQAPAQQFAKRISWPAKRIVLVQSLPTRQGVIYSLVAE